MHLCMLCPMGEGVNSQNCLTINWFVYFSIVEFVVNLLLPENMLQLRCEKQKPKIFPTQVNIIVISELNYKNTIQQSGPTKYRLNAFTQ